jgi:hypothetical protein
VTTPAARRAVLAAAGAGVAACTLLATAAPAAAHAGTTELPAPDWLLAYAGVFVVLIATVAARSAVAAAPRPEQRAAPDRGAEPEPPVAAQPWTAWRRAARALGLALLAAIVAIAVAGPDNRAGNLAPVAVLSLWWVGMPLVAALAGDVVRALNPVDTIAAGVRIPWRTSRSAPRWTAAASLGAIGWYMLAYHSPAEPRVLAVALVTYCAAALAGAATWGRSWLVEGEAFAAISRAVAGIVRGRHPRPTSAITVAAVVWTGTTLFEALTSTTVWVDVAGSRDGWSRTVVDTVGLVWATALVAGVHIVAMRTVARLRGDERALDAVPVVVGLGWLLAHELPDIVVYAQNAAILASDPFARGWDLFATRDHDVRYDLLSPATEGYVQLGLLAAAHVAAVALAVRALRERSGTAAALRLSWVVGAEVAVAVVTATLLLVGGAHT